MKFISSAYDPSSGVSKVTMQHLGVKFDGWARVHPQESEKASEYAGCYYAELRATIKALKYERQLAKNKADQALDFVKSCECYAKFNKDSATSKAMYRQLNQRIKRVNDLADKINNLYHELDNGIRSRDVVIKAIESRKAKQDNS